MSAAEGTATGACDRKAPRASSWRSHVGRPGNAASVLVADTATLQACVSHTPYGAVTVSPPRLGEAKASRSARVRPVSRATSAVSRAPQSMPRSR